jgi:hypothetical protein
MQKRANSIGRQSRNYRRPAGAIVALTLAWRVLALGATGHLGAQCGGEAKVSIERIGPQGTSAEG